MIEQNASHAYQKKKKNAPCKILIVDDDAADRVLYKNHLRCFDQQTNYAFFEAENGAEGIKMFKDIRPNCILLDYLLPDMTGLDVLKKMAVLNPILPVVMLTGQGNENIAAETIKCGAQNYLAKNVITPESLHRAIINTIDRAVLLNQVENQNKLLKEAKEKAEKADRTKSDFLATMSHEIRTPLNGIIGMAELMGYTKLNEKQKKYLQSIGSSGELLLTIINDILDFSKIEAGDLELESNPVELKPLLTEIIQLLGSRANENRVELIVSWPKHDDIPTIFADPMRLRQILLNLIGNAIKFTKDGTVTICVDHSKNKARRIALRFEIIDTGIGIPKDKIESIFDQFSQVDSSTTRQFGGTGLGLTICKKLVQCMNGKIGVESEIGAGSNFWFEIDVPFEPEKREPNFKRDLLKGKKILVVDDCDLNVELFQEYLATYKADVEIALSAQAALKSLSEAQKNEEPFDILLSDYVMPHMDGEALGQRIFDNPEIYGQPKAVLITGLGKKQNAAALKRAGFSATLFKPIYPDALISCIEKILSEKVSLENVTEAIVSEAIPQFSIHALIVDDDRISMRMSRSILDEVGATYDCAGNGQEAIEVLSQSPEKYDIVMMDWQMPIMDGHEAIKNIRQMKWGKELKIIALTANAIQGDREKCIEVGADDYLSKPVRLNDIVKILNEHIKKISKKAA